MHVDGSRRCSTIAAMIGACSPLSRSRELGSSRIPNPMRQGSIPWRPAHVVLASRTANARRKPKRSWVKVPETTPSHRAGSTAVSYAARRRFNSVRCDEVFRGVAKWYRARFGTARPEVRSLSPRQRSCRMRDRALPHRGEIQEVHLPRRRVSW